MGATLRPRFLDTGPLTAGEAPWEPKWEPTSSSLVVWEPLSMRSAALKLRDHADVDVHGRAEIGVTQHVLDLLPVDAEFVRAGSGRVSQGVESAPVEAGAVADRGNVPVEVARLDIATSSAGKDEIEVGPGVAERLSLGVLSLPVLVEHLDALGGQREVAVRGDALGARSRGALPCRGRAGLGA